MPLTTRSLTRLALPAVALVLFGQGCLGGSSSPTGPNGGVWKTTDHGATWANKRALVQGPKLSTGAALFDIVTLTMDPQDNMALYAGTSQNGLAYSLDGGDSWQLMKGISSGKVNAIAVNPKDKCTVYVARANEIDQTKTCGRDWSRVFYDPDTSKSFTTLAVDWFNPNNVFAGTSAGDILKSSDGGGAWLSAKRVDGVRITDIDIDPRDSRLVYVGTLGSGIFKTADGGANWVQIQKEFGDDLRDARRVTQLVIDPKSSNTLYVVSKLGIIRSDDQGQTWHAINLTSAAGTVQIASLAIDPNDSKKMVYTGANTLAYTSDAGTTWTVKKLPTTQSGSSLVIDPKDGNIIYLGTVTPAGK